MYSFFTHIATSTESTFEMRFPLQNLKAGSPQSTLLYFTFPISFSEYSSYRLSSQKCRKISFWPPQTQRDRICVWTVPVPGYSAISVAAFRETRVVSVVFPNYKLITITPTLLPYFHLFLMCSRLRKMLQPVVTATRAPYPVLYN